MHDWGQLCTCGYRGLAFLSTFIFMWRHLTVPSLSSGTLSSLGFHSLDLEVSVSAIYSSGLNSWLKPSPIRSGHLQKDTLK